jgi:hypothetical protein
MHDVYVNASFHTYLYPVTDSTLASPSGNRR